MNKSEGSFSIFLNYHSLVNHVFIQGDLTVILLVDIQVLHQALVQEILKGSGVKKSMFQNDKNEMTICMKN